MTRYIENIAEVGKYLPASFFKIAQWEWEGLCWFVEQARAGYFTYIDYPIFMALPEHGFDMGNSCIIHECGTIACVGGWVYLHKHGSAPRTAVSYVASHAHRSALAPLYFPKRYNHRPEAVANVVEHMLLTGQVDWSKAK